MIKVAMIGAGSVVFSKNLTGDILSYPEFKNATIAYMDVDRDRLEVGAGLCRKVARALGATPKIQATLDRREALRGADFVINMVQIGGFDATLVDFEIPRKYGLNFTIADTTGPGGLFRALRTYPMLRALCRDMEALCPRAVLLNYSNPMSMNMQTVFRTSGVRAVGLCHSVQGTFDQLMGYLGEDPAGVAFECAGINHMAFYLRIEKGGVDLYPRLFEAMGRDEVYNSNKVRFELMKRLGYFVTESSEHNAEYNPFFIPHGRERVARFDVPIDEYLRRCERCAAEFERMRVLATSDEPMAVRKSHEYGSTIIHSIATGRPSVVYANVPNDGCISNLPRSAVVEVATVVDRAGPRPTTAGELPPQLVAYVQPHVAQHELFIRAATEGRRDHLYHAAMFDPLTAATLPPDRIVEMCDELIDAHGHVEAGGSLPRLDEGRTVVGTAAATVPRARTDARALRASWESAKSGGDGAYVDTWHVIGPFRSPHEGVISIEMKTLLEDEFLGRGDGTVNLKGTYGWGESAARWKKVTASPRNGLVNLSAEIGPYEWAVAYGYAELTSTAAREAHVRCGSDDGIRVWVNGRLAHTTEARRPYRPGDDTFIVRLNAGVNRLLVKVDNARFAWGFGLSIDREPA